MTLTGNYFNLSNFFNRLESFVTSDNGTLSIRGRLMTINAINLVPGANGFPQITATVSATTYIVPPTEGAFGGATPPAPRRPPRPRPRLPDPLLRPRPRPLRQSPRCCDERPPQHAEGTGRAQALADRAGADHRPGGGAGAADQEGADGHRHPAHRSAALLLGDHAARDLGADDARQLEARRQGPQSVHPAAGRHDRRPPPRFCPRPLRPRPPGASTGTATVSAGAGSSSSAASGPSSTPAAPARPP